MAYSSPRLSALARALALAAACSFAAAGALAEPPASLPPPAAAATVLGTEIRTSDAEELRYLILRPLTDRYAAARGIEVTPAEIDAYRAHMATVAERDRREREARLAGIERELAASGLAGDRRTALAAERDMLTRLARDLDRGATTPQEAAEEAQARRMIAAAFIRQWKINQALYREYGGRIVFQQGGPEPLDAYRRFLEDQQQRGAFAITDAGLAAAFWRYYRDDAIHSFYPAGSTEETQIFASPWWLAE